MPTSPPTPSEPWRAHLLTTTADVRKLLQRVRRVAVLGIRSEQHPDRPAFYVADALQRMGLEIVPVPVHDSPARILGQQTYRSLAEVPGRIDLVDVFRRSEDVPAHLADLLTARPAAVWLQSGIRNEEVAERLAREGIDIVQNRCLMVDYRALGQR